MKLRNLFKRPAAARPVAAPAIAGAGAGGAAMSGGLEADNLPASRSQRTGDITQTLRAYIRFLGLFATTLLVALVLLVDTIRIMMPLKEVQTRVVTIRERDQLAMEITPMPVSGPAARDMIEQLALGYIRMRLEVLPSWAEMNKRWGTDCLAARRAVSVSVNDDQRCSYVAAHSTQEVYNRFTSSLGPKAEKWIEDGLARSVTYYMDPIWHKEGEEGYLEVRLWLIDYDAGDDPSRMATWLAFRNGDPPAPEIERVHLNVHLWYRFNQPRKEQGAVVELNPLNFMVTKWEAVPGQAGGAAPAANGEK